jgi:DNA-directed RNA polymerase specialized sigma24 family protein
MRRWGALGRRRQAHAWANRPDDPELVERARRDPEAFRALYDRYFQPTYGLVYSRVQNEALARDLTAQVFVRAKRLIRVYRHSGSFRSWLRTLALITLARSGQSIYRRRGPAMDQGFQSAGCPAPLRPVRPTLSAAVALPLPPVVDGPGIVYALGRSV